MDYTTTQKETRRNSNEGFLTLLSGLRKIGNITSGDISYNNALADVFDHIIETQKDCLFDHTVFCGKWVRDKQTTENLVTIDDKICGGEPCLYGTRITVSNMLDGLSQGQTIQEFSEDLEIDVNKVKMALLWIRERLGDSNLETLEKQLKQDELNKNTKEHNTASLADDFCSQFDDSFY